MLHKDPLLLPIHPDARVSVPEVHIQSQTVLVFNQHSKKEHLTYGTVDLRGSLLKAEIGHSYFTCT